MIIFLSRRTSTSAEKTCNTTLDLRSSIGSLSLSSGRGWVVDAWGVASCAGLAKEEKSDEKNPDESAAAVGLRTFMACDNSCGLEDPASYTHLATSASM